MKPVDKFAPVEGFKEIQLDRKTECLYEKDVVVEVEDSAVLDTDSAELDTNLEYSKWNLANLICYHHREGMSVEGIAELCKTDMEFVEDVVIEAKDAGVYDDLADVLKIE